MIVDFSKARTLVIRPVIEPVPHGYRGGTHWSHTDRVVRRQDEQLPILGQGFLHLPAVRPLR